MTQKNAAAGKPGRREQAADRRRRRILLHAQRSLIQHGYFNTSLNAVIRKAGGSKASITRYFGNKAGLVTAVLEDVTRQFVADRVWRTAGVSPSADLQAIGTAVLRFYLRKDALSVYRSVVGEGFRHKQLALVFFQSGHRTLVHALAERLQHWNRAGELHSREPEHDADCFLHALRGGLYEQVLLGLRAIPVPDSAIVEKVRATVRIFAPGLQNQSLSV